jgi:hypothetical protein
VSYFYKCLKKTNIIWNTTVIVLTVIAKSAKESGKNAIVDATFVPSQGQRVLRIVILQGGTNQDRNDRIRQIIRNDHINRPIQKKIVNANAKKFVIKMISTIVNESVIVVKRRKTNVKVEK